MDAPEPDTPFAAVSAQTTKYGRIYQSYLDKSTPFTTYRWVGTGVVLVLFILRIIFAQGWYIGMLDPSIHTEPLSPDGQPRKDTTFADSIYHVVAYSLGIYLLNLFLAFLSPKFDPGLETDTDMEEGGPSSSLPTKSTDEFKPFVRRLPEFKFWYSATKAIVIGFACSWSEIFNLPVFWPVLVFYWLILFVLTMRRQIQHMLSKSYNSSITTKQREQHGLGNGMEMNANDSTEYRYVPWDFGKKAYGKSSSN